MSKLARLLPALALMLGMLVTGVASAASAMEDIVSSGTLTVAVQTQGPPVSFVDKEGERTGLAIEIVRMMAEDMGVELDLRPYKWQGLIPALLSGKVDLIAADMTPTPQRSLRLLFTDPIFYTSVIAFAKEGKPFTSWKELNSPDVTIGTVEASSFAAAARKFLPKANLKLYRGGTPAVAQAVAAGRVDAGISDHGNARSILPTYPEFTVLDGVLRKEPLSFATRPDSVHLLMFLNNYMQVIELDGRLDELLDYWWRSSAWQQEG